MGTRIHGLYVIIDPDACEGRPAVDIARLALQGGASVIQWRDKRRSKGDQLSEAAAIRELCAAHGALFIVNDHADLAAATQADGVHLGQRDLPIPDVRRMVGGSMLIGVSTNTVEEALLAEADGAAYVAVGAIFATLTKHDTRPATLNTLRQIKRAVRLPVVAIGGITSANIVSVLANGADAVAVISAVCSAADPEHAAAQLARAFSPVPASLTQPEQLRGIVRRYIGSINDRDRDRFVALFAPDGIREDPAGTHIGPDSIGKSWDQMHLHDRPFQIRVHNIVVVRQEAALYWSIEHQHEDGGSALARGVEIIGVEDNGQIASARSYWSRDAAAGSRTRSIAEATVAALNAKDCAAYADLWAEDGMWQAPLSPMPTIGIDNVRVSCEAMMSSTPNFSVQVDAVCASGAEAALAWTTVLRGRQRERIVSGVDIIALDNDGKIAALHSYWEPDGSP